MSSTIKINYHFVGALGPKVGIYRLSGDQRERVQLAQAVPHIVVSPDQAANNQVERYDLARVFRFLEEKAAVMFPPALLPQQVHDLITEQQHIDLRKYLQAVVLLPSLEKAKDISLLQYEWAGGFIISMAKASDSDIGYFMSEAEPFSQIEIDKTAFVNAYRGGEPRPAEEIVQSIYWLKLQAKVKIN